jgi:mycothiol synthase
MAVEIRRLTGDDLDALTSLVAAARDRGDMAGSSDPEAAFMVRVAAAEHDTFAVAEAGGTLVGFIGPGFKVVVVEPAWRRRGIGRRLVDVGGAIEAARGNPLVFMGPPPDDADALGFLRATGFAMHSTLWDLDLPGDRAVPPPTWALGVVPRPYHRDPDLEAWVALFNAAFADHVTPLQLDAALMRASDVDADSRDEDLLVVADADDPDRFLGFVACEPRRVEDGVEERAEIWTIGVDPSRQGAGLGRQLLRWGVEYLRALGVTTITLSVNGRNERALGLYESEGFVRTHTRDRWARTA